MNSGDKRFKKILGALDRGMSHVEDAHHKNSQWRLDNALDHLDEASRDLKALLTSLGDK